MNKCVKKLRIFLFFSFLLYHPVSCWFLHALTTLCKFDIDFTRIYCPPSYFKDCFTQWLFIFQYATKTAITVAFTFNRCNVVLRAIVPSLHTSVVCCLTRTINIVKPWAKVLWQTVYHMSFGSCVNGLVCQLTWFKVSCVGRDVSISIYFCQSVIWFCHDPVLFQCPG